MTDTSGQKCTGLSPSELLAQCLASRLQARTASLGSRVYKLTWKERAMPSGRSIPALRASQMKRETKGSTSDSDSIGERKGWNTPRASDGSNGGPNQSGGALSHDASLCGWATPKATDGSGGRTTETAGGGNVHLDKQARLTGWPTPMASERNASEETMAKRLAFRQKNGQTSVPMYLNEAAQLAGWPTPLSAPDSPASHNQVSGQFRRAMAAAMPESTGSTAETGSTGRLRAGHSRWLMRIPSVWDDCVPTETPSMLRKRAALSKRGSTAAPIDVSDIA